MITLGTAKNELHHPYRGLYIVKDNVTTFFDKSADILYAQIKMFTPLETLNILLNKDKYQI